VAHLNQLRRAVAHALRNGWRRDHLTDVLCRTWPSGRVRGIAIVMSDTIRPRLLTIRELDVMDGRNVSIRRAITVLTAEYDEHGEPLA
jgi:hypothetical protein